jgi:hypothetical protein
MNRASAQIKPVTPAPPERRAALRAAIAERAVAEEQLRRAQQAEKRGHDLLDAAEAKVAVLGDVDDLILGHRADKIKQAAAGGPAPNMSLPDDLVERKAASDEAQAVLAAAKAAHQSLVADVAQAEAANRKAELKVSGCAVEILVAKGMLKAGALKLAWGKVWELNALAGCWWPGAGAPRRTELPAAAIRPLQVTAQYDHRQFAGNFNSGLKRSGERWRAWHAALCRDADAEMPEIVHDGASSTAVDSAA